MFIKLPNGNTAIIGRMETVEERAMIEAVRRITLNDEVAVIESQSFENSLMKYLEDGTSTKK